MPRTRAENSQSDSLSTESYPQSEVTALELPDFSVDLRGANRALFGRHPPKKI